MTNPFRTDLIAIFVRRGHKGKEIIEEVKEIEALLDGQRCQWRLTCFGWETECGNKYPYILTQINKCCSFCGKRIEVKDGQG